MTPPSRDTPSATNVWYRRGAAFGDGFFVTSAHANDQHPDGAVVVADNVRAEDFGSVTLDASETPWRVTPSAHGLAHVDVSIEAIPGVPSVWFVFVPEAKADTPAANLVAYPVDALDSPRALPSGTVVSANRFPMLGVSNDEQVGAIRWYPSGGLIHQIYVREDARRQHLGTLLLYTASAFHQARGWPGRLHADGRRTDLGERFAAGMQYPNRFETLTERQPDMDDTR